MYAPLFLTLSFLMSFSVQTMENKKKLLVQYYGDIITPIQTFLPNEVQINLINPDAHGPECWKVKITFDCTTRIKSAQFNEDETEIVIIPRDNDSSIEFDIKTQKHGGLVQHNKSSILGKLNKEKTRELTAFSGQTAEIWCTKTRKPIKSFLHANLIKSAEFNKDETIILTTCEDDNAYLWNIETEEIIHNFQHDQIINSAQLNKNETLLLTSCEDDNAYLWDVEKEEIIITLKHDFIVESAHFNKNDTKILTTGYNNNVWIWNVKKQQLSSWLKHRSRVCSAQFNTDETKILTACYDGNVYLWEQLNVQWSLDQRLLWKLLCTWLVVQKPDKTITSSQEFITNIALYLKDTDNELINIWNTFHKNVQEILSQKINTLIQRHGK